MPVSFQAKGHPRKTGNELLALAVLLLTASACAQDASADRQPGSVAPPVWTVAITTDEPSVGRGHPLAYQPHVTRDLLAQTETARVPATGYVEADDSPDR